MTDAELAAIRARRAAIVGEHWYDNSYSAIWASVPYGHPWDRFTLDGDPPNIFGKGGAYIATIAKEPTSKSRGDELGNSDAAKNRDFIANAPQDIDALLAEVDRLRSRPEGWVLTHEGHERVTAP